MASGTTPRPQVVDSVRTFASVAELNGAGIKILHRLIALQKRSKTRTPWLNRHVHFTGHLPLEITVSRNLGIISWSQQDGRVLTSIVSWRFC